jgi:hypothetical protein
LALEQAAAYLEQTRMSLPDYLGLLSERAGDLLELGELTDHPDTVATTWALSLARALAEAPAAEDLAALCAFLAPDDIPRSLPAEHTQLLPELLRQATGDRLAYARLVGVLGRYSLVTVSEDGLALHRLVQAWVRARPSTSRPSDTGQRLRSSLCGPRSRLTSAMYGHGRPAPGCSLMRWCH